MVELNETTSKAEGPVRKAEARTLTRAPRRDDLGPCSICGSTRSRRSRHFSGEVYCDATTRDRCRERELAQAIAQARADLEARR